jgi:hypothetical protein
MKEIANRKGEGPLPEAPPLLLPGGTGPALGFLQRKEHGFVLAGYKVKPLKLVVARPACY